MKHDKYVDEVARNILSVGDKVLIYADVELEYLYLATLVVTRIDDGYVHYNFYKVPINKVFFSVISGCYFCWSHDLYNGNN